MASSGDIEARKKQPWRIRLRQALDDRGIQYEQASERAGRNPEFLSKVFNGRLNPSVEVILSVCANEGIRAAYVFSDDDETLETAREETSLLSENEAQLVQRLIASSNRK